ncbi:MAG: WxcM-like domain-containing protein [Flexistipes sinusarabici]|uniref:WxcM-like domain-containing protein n=1 Tax=Flexistipes sinusarabici TaxID=2352 RepID=A0A5D0MLH9_FLESI|nr:FdtA/QdtA family cupin domain-containing protein [Flexistipes sinusarabici]TYB33262.1 MAG: WxcM-like domain-containing protein [Flexistipes sinusarabici]
MMQVKTINFNIKGDDRGSLIALEQHKEIPFDIKRVYYIFGTKEGVRRGYHAHKSLKQVAVCVKGSCKFLLDDGKSKEYVELNSPDLGLLIDKFVWREMYDFSPDCVLVVFADDYYDEGDYIRDYKEFIRRVENDS